MSPPIKEKQNNELEQLATSVVLLDKNLNIKYLNPSAEILFQISLKKVKDREISLIFEDIDYLKYRIDKSIQRSSTYKEHECQIKIKDIIKTVTFTVTPYDDDDYEFILEFHGYYFFHILVFCEDSTNYPLVFVNVHFQK